MKKLFISQPMKDKTDEQIKAEREVAIQKAEALIGESVEVIDSFFESAPHVLVTDQKSKTYEKNRYIKCFDFTKPTLNAAVSDGLLSIQAHDTDSGIAAVYVNGYEFKDLSNGVLNIRLQQFDQATRTLPFLQWIRQEICLTYIRRAPGSEKIRF